MAEKIDPVVHIKGWSEDIRKKRVDYSKVILNRLDSNYELDLLIKFWIGTGFWIQIWFVF